MRRITGFLTLIRPAIIKNYLETGGKLITVYEKQQVNNNTPGTAVFEYMLEQYPLVLINKPTEKSLAIENRDNIFC